MIELIYKLSLLTFKVAQGRCVSLQCCETSIQAENSGYILFPQSSFHLALRRRMHSEGNSHLRRKKEVAQFRTYRFLFLFAGLWRHIQKVDAKKSTRMEAHRKLEKYS